jgi:hypothetical protein
MAEMPGNCQLAARTTRPLRVTQLDRDGLNTIETADRHRLGTARFRSFDSAALVNEKAASPAVSI